MFPWLSHEVIANSLRHILKSVGVEDVDACYAWAFGDDWLTLLVSASDDRWNERHGDLFLLSGSSPLVESLRRVGRAYLNRKKERCKHYPTQEEGTCVCGRGSDVSGGPVCTEEFSKGCPYTEEKGGKG